MIHLILYSIGCFLALPCRDQILKLADGNPPQLIYSRSTGMPLELIEPGAFLMGSPENEFQSDTNEHPQHLVSLTKPFYLGIYEVTQHEFTTTMGFNPSTVKGNEQLPVETLSWFDAVSFCNQLSKKDGLDSVYAITNKKTEGAHVISADVKWDRHANGYRLPTEAEWEFACRGGTTTPFPYGNSINTDQANYDGTLSYYGQDGSEHLVDTTRGIFRRKPLPVDSLIPNAIGLYNIVGNVFEWVWDYYAKYPATPQTDPSGPPTGADRIRRSASYSSPGYHMRSALRHAVPPGLALFHQGLRVAKNSPVG